jgi:hypothetical protein
VVVHLTKCPAAASARYAHHRTGPALAASPGSAQASRAFGITSLAFGITSLALGVVAALAAVGAYLATHVSDDRGRRTRAAKPRHSADLMTAASQGSNS